MVFELGLVFMLINHVVKGFAIYPKLELTALLNDEEAIAI